MLRLGLSKDPVHAAVELAGLSAVGGAWAIFTILRARKTGGWPSVDGIVTWSMLAERGGRRRPYYDHDIKYKYRVRTIEREGTRVSFGSESSSSFARTQASVDRYPAGTKVRVYFDPTKPENAVLERQVSVEAYYILLIAAGVAIAAIWMYVTR